MMPSNGCMAILSLSAFLSGTDIHTALSRPGRTAALGTLLNCWLQALVLVDEEASA